MTLRRLAPLALLLVLGAACASAPNASPQEQALHVLQGANAAYEETMTAAGRAYRAGLLDDNEIDQVRTAGRAAEAALRTAKASLETWLALGPDVDVGTGEAVADVQAAMLSLLRVWADVKGGA